MIRIRQIAAAALLLSCAARAGDVKVAMQHKNSDGPSVSHYTMNDTDWVDAPSEKILKAPKFRSAAKWGEIKLGGAGDRVFTVALDDPGQGDALLYVDANNNEDLTDDGEPAKEYSKESTSLGKYWKLQIERGKTRTEYQMYVYWYRANQKGFTAYCAMDWWEGTANFAGESIRFGIVDRDNDGCFDDLDKLALVLDYNKDGRLDGQQDSNEYHTGEQPFAAGGRGWVVKTVSEGGDEVVFAEHSGPVEMRPPLGPGSPSLDFTGKDKDGNEVALSSFLGKIVLLHFWSYMSGDKTIRLDEHTKLWKEYREKGYVILGVNLDTEAEKAKEFAASHGMDWPIVYDGGMLEGPIAKLYRTYTYPRCYLIDPDGVIRDNNIGVENLARAVGEMLSDADAEPLVAAKSEDLARFLPRVEKGDWWLVFHQRRGDYDYGDFLLFMVMEVSEKHLGLVMTSTQEWSYALTVDRATWNVVRVTPTWTDWDQKAEKIRVSPEKDGSVDVKGSPTFAMARQYPLFDVLFHAFPHPGDGLLTAMTENTGQPTQSQTFPMSCESFVDANGRLVGKFRTSVDGRVLRVKQTWEPGLPFPRRISYSNSVCGSRGLLILCRAGKKFGLAFPAAPAAYRILGMESNVSDLPATRAPCRNLVGEDAVAAACARLAPGKPSQSFDIRGDAYFHRGDVFKIYWQVRAIPRAVSGPSKPPEKTVEIPVSGTFAIEVVDLRRVGDEELIFLLAFGEDTRAFSYDTNYSGMQGEQEKTIADFLTGSGASAFSNEEYWSDPDPKKARWDRVGYLRGKRYGGYQFNTVYANSKPATTWVVALRREDLSLRAAYGFHLDAHLKAGDFGVAADTFAQGPAFVRQSLQLVRPQDWLLVQAFAGLKVGASKGNVLNLSPKDEGFFRYELLKDEEGATQLVKNDKFFTAFSELLAKRTPPPEERKGKRKRQAKVAMTEQDVAKLEGGFSSGDFSGVVRRLEDGSARRDLNVFRTTNGPGLWVYHGYDGTYSWWKESLVLNWKEGYLARLRSWVPVPPKPGS